MESKQVVWTPTMSAYMLAHLCDVVANGTRTSTGFKKSHIAACVNALNDHFQLNLTGVQIGYHNRTWRRKWQKIVKLKALSGVGWDEEKCMIVLDHEHYANHIKDHKDDEPFLNKLIEHYHELATIHGNSMATGQYARGSNEPLATEVTNLEEDETNNVASHEEVTQSHNGGESSAPKPKKSKSNPCAEERLQATLIACSERLAIAIEKNVSNDNNSTEGLWESIKILPGFSLDYLAHYYAYLVENPRIAKAFQVLEETQKMIWVARYVKNTFPKVED